MGEEEKKPEENPTEEKKPEEAKKSDEVKKEDKEEKPSDDKKGDESKDTTPPPPPQEIILRVYMHCEGCARKVRRCLKGFEGVEDVQTDCKAHKVVVKGEKADPLKVLERVRRKSHRQVELLSPIPKPKIEEPKKMEEKEIPKPQEKKEELPVITVVLNAHMHCEACAQEIKKRILRMKGVENAEPDLKSSQVTVRGAFEAEKLVEYVRKRTGKHAAIVKVEPEKKEEEEKGKEEKKGVEGGDKDEKKAEAESKDKEGGSGEAAAAAPPAKAEEGEGKVEIEEAKMELKKNELHYPYAQNFQVNYPQQKITQEFYGYATPEFYGYPPPQMFSDENPNACSVM